MKLILQKAGLLLVARRLKRVVRRGFARPQPTRDQIIFKRFQSFKQKYGHLFRHSLNAGNGSGKKVLLLSPEWPLIELELGIIKALELAGYVPVVILITEESEVAKAYFHMAKVEVYFCGELLEPPDKTSAEAIVERYSSIRDFLNFRYENARVGRFAVATALRWHKLGSLNLQSGNDRNLLVAHLASAIASTKTAHRIINEIHPELLLFMDRVYTPSGEIVDVCLANGITAIAWDIGHKGNTLMLKRYTSDNIDVDTTSVSTETWEKLQAIEWTEAHSDKLHEEFLNSYAKGDWYGQCATQYNKRFLEADEIKIRLGLDPSKKTAFIFPHISWDASFFYGEDLFANYEEWLVETVRVACTNDQVNWIIKIHPAHLGKNVQDSFSGLPAEINAINKYIGELPHHIFIIQAESDINTFSLFGMMDYCVTVRGTIGIEAARLGIPVFTGGTGRYSHKGFTIDSDSREDYLGKMAVIQNYTRLSAARQELAQRFAYGLFVLRPFPLKTLTLEFHDVSGNNETEIKIGSNHDWYNAPDIVAMADWVNDPNQPVDFLLPDMK